jgi:hypothetical protein
MAAEITKTESTFNVFKEIVWAWTAHTDGKVITATTNSQTDKADFNGKIEQLITVPDTGTAPSDNYTVKVYDKYNIDVLAGAATANRDTANTEQVLSTSLGAVVNSPLNLYIEGAGSGGKGTVYLRLR